MFLTIKKYIVDKHEDPLNYMKQADQEGAAIVSFFLKNFGVACPMSVIVGSVASLIYSKWNYGYINIDKLYHSARFAYAFVKMESIFKFFIKFY